MVEDSGCLPEYDPLLPTIKSIINELRISFIVTVCLAILLCGIYPALVWAVAQGLFHSQANGWLVSVKGQKKIAAYTEGCNLMIFGEPRVNFLDTESGSGSGSKEVSTYGL
jgi:K+-transporting ATPase c subunit